MLKDDADLRAAQFGQGIFGHGGDGLPQSFRLAFAGAQQAGDNGEQACFTRTRRTGEGGGFAGANGCG